MRSKRTALLMRCIPRFGYQNTEVRMIDLDVSPESQMRDIWQRVNVYFAARRIHDAVYDVGVDNDGYYAVINDEAFGQDWGKPVL